MAIKLLSDKVSYESTPEYLKILILGRIDKWKESLLLGWIVAWSFCGAVVAHEYWISTDRDLKLIYTIFMIFWIYYFYRIGRVWIFRKGGNELIRIENGELILKKSFFTYGKTQTFQLENISHFRKVDLNKRSPVYTYESGWWVLGGQRLCFVHNGRYVKFAMQISEPVCNKVHDLIQKRITKYSKSLN